MILKLRNQRIIKTGKPRSVLTADVSSGDTTADVLSDSKFSGTNKFVLFGNMGDENSEIVSFTSATGNTLTVGALAKDHPKNTPVYLIDADQVQFMRSTSTDGTYTELGKVDINPEDEYTIYDDTSNTTGYGKARFWNSGSSAAYGSYYEIIRYDENTRRTRGFAKEVALDDMGAEIDDLQITEDFLNRQISLCDDIIREAKINWNEEAYELTVNTELGITEYDISSYIKHTQIIDSILYARIGDKEIIPMNRDEFDRKKGNAVKTTLASAISSTTDTTVTVTDASDFDDSGSVCIEGDVISYTSVDKDTGVLSGVSDIDETHSVETSDGNDAEVWQNYDAGTPDYLTLIDGSIHTYPLITDETDVKNIQMTISKKYTQLNDDSDELPFPTNLYVSFLSYKIGKRRGDEDYADLYTIFRNELTRYKIQQGSAVKRQLRPGVAMYNTNRR